MRTTIAHGLLTLSFLMVPAFVHAGLFSALFSIVDTPADASTSESSTYNAQTTPLLKADAHIDAGAPKGGGDIQIGDDGALVPSLGPSGLGGDSSDGSGEIAVYVVRQDDDLTHIARMFDVSVNTILWANDIRDAKTIQPGDELIILPVTGIRHIVKKGDTIESIAKKYNGDVDDIMLYNQLASRTDIAPGQTVVIPGGEAEEAPVPVKVAQKATSGVRVNAGGSTATGGYYAKPLKSYVKTQGIHGYNAVDLAVPLGTPVYAAAAGQVIISKNFGYNGGYGQYIVIKHPNGTQTLYAHLSANLVSAGATVAQGDQIARSGTTGRSTGPHLHFEVRGARNPF